MPEPAGAHEGKAGGRLAGLTALYWCGYTATASAQSATRYTTALPGLASFLVHFPPSSPSVRSAPLLHHFAPLRTTVSGMHKS